MGVKKIKIVKKIDYPEIKKLSEYFKVSNDGEICLAIGGDGTFLKAAREFEGPILPIRGLEKSSLGFHADFTVKGMDEVIESLCNNSYTIEEYSKLKFTYKDGVYDAVNDIIIFRATPKTIHCKICYDENSERKRLYPKDLKGDGVIFSGQIGSTAYNFFARGPIIYGIDAIVVTPILANFGFSIISNRYFYTEVTKNIAMLEYDGINLDTLHKGDNFNIEKSDKKVKIVKLSKKESFSKKLARLTIF